ncbi:GDP-mannose mannosyl hydrolase [Escherichia coli]|nr:GDP-mannose mannosyl hydrolase [Escherichia coli]
MSLLNDNLFSTIINHTPLVAIDLIIENEFKEILVGKRINRPARGFWFVPGGRIRKNESLIDAFSRVCQSEIDLAASINNAKFFGVYEHFYNDSFYGDEFSTHYVVLAYKILVDKNNIIPSFGQHDQYSWMNYSDLIKDDSVHDNTKAYFIK